MSNLGWLFYKDYFNGLDFHNLENQKNQKLIVSKVKNIVNFNFKNEDREPIGEYYLDLTTTYPGLLIGSGYMHELKDVEGQLILGFNFDYTSGLPIIPASSIKGVIRSAFKHIDYIRNILDIDELEDEDIEILESEIFDKADDIFYDAVIIKADSSNKILEEDYITPHKNNPLQNPIPLKFLKIRPDVSFRFEFDLKDSSITIEEKLRLFEQILKDLGIGAKTNVGYGQFIGSNLNRIQKQAKELKKQKLNSQERAIELFETYKKRNEIGQLFKEIEQGKIDSDISMIKLFQLVIDDIETSKHKGAKQKDKAQKRVSYLKDLMLKEFIWSYLDELSEMFPAKTFQNLKTSKDAKERDDFYEMIDIAFDYDEKLISKIEIESKKYLEKEDDFEVLEKEEINFSEILSKIEKTIETIEKKT
jgi:CRISPR-associated protein Cmr6